MKIKYLGTAAAEGWPAIFCRCEACERAKKLGGKDVRTRSQAIINDDLLIDFPADTYMHVLRNDLDLSAVQTMLVTHSHMDHFVPQDLVLRGSCYAHDMKSPELDIYCNETVLERYRAFASCEQEEEIEKHLHFNVFKYFSPFETRSGRYRITPLPARHALSEKAAVYFIEENVGDSVGYKNVLYLHDTGYPYDEVFEFCRSKRFDLVSFDCTHGNVEAGLNNGHMGLVDATAALNRLKMLGAVDNRTICVLNHFSHNCGLSHDELCRVAEKEGFLVSYDGMEIEF